MKPEGETYKDMAALVARFRDHLDSYKSGAYNETQLRREFLDPFFKALGWDVDNVQGYAEAYKDVIHEDAIKIGGATKAPDYCFRIGGTRKFFVEAKKPSVYVKEEIPPAFQLRRYAWSAKLPLSILTDFEEFAVYDCRIKPDKNDKASVGRILYMTFNDYLDRWEEIASIFSRDAILKGSFDKFAEKGKKRGTAEVDDAFLKEIESWRDILAKNIVLKNPDLSQRDLNFSVQRTIDRIVFLRIAEDRGIEEFGRLQALLNGVNVYAKLRELYRKADERYNSGLFHFDREKDRHEEPDTLTPGLVIDDKPLKDILRRLYYPESPYEFSVLPADILGQVYEQFLGKVIRLTAGHQAKVEEKPEVRKAGGVYYTPTYIVDYIVNNTVGKLVEDKSPKEVSAIKILDPACGSGSFLLGAYQYLLDWHLKWYSDNDPQKWLKGKSPSIYQADGGGYRLTASERKRILLNNIFGVDIDSQAVEVTKLSLLLKVIEGESGDTITRQFKLLHERALPDLGMNIKCGNSLIGPDFYDGSLFSRFEKDKPSRPPFEKGGQGGFSDDERLKINAFDWNTEFPSIMKRGGFDAVIGNPPYVRIQGFPREQIEYLTKTYSSAKGNCDLYVSFVERGYKLLNPKGLLGNILPNKFFKTDYGEGLRTLLTNSNAIYKIVDFDSEQVFNATTYTCLLFIGKQRNTKFQYAKAKATPESLKELSFDIRESITLSNNTWSFLSSKTSALFNKILFNSKRLLDLPAEMSRGSSTGNDEVFVFEKGELNIEKEIIRIPLYANDFDRYTYTPSDKWRIIFPYVLEENGYRLITDNELKKKYPKAFKYLISYKNILEKRKQYAEWFAYSAPRNLQLHDKAQILVPLLANRGMFTLVPETMQGKLCPMASGGFTIALHHDCKVQPEYVIGLLNSKLLFWKLQEMSNVFRGGWITCTKQYFGELPIRSIDFSDKTDKAIHDRMVSLVDDMLNLNKKLPSAKTDLEKTALKRRIDYTDREIDKLVYRLYDLTDDEIAIVEGS